VPLAKLQSSYYENPFPLIGSLPKISIRPTIDGRRKGVRESLEKQVMGMAKNAAKFLSVNLRYPNGKPVQCVIADFCIGGVAGPSRAPKSSRARAWACPSVVACFVPWRLCVKKSASSAVKIWRWPKPAVWCNSFRACEN